MYLSLNFSFFLFLFFSFFHFFLLFLLFGSVFLSFTLSPSTFFFLSFFSFLSFIDFLSSPVLHIFRLTLLLFLPSFLSLYFCLFCHFLPLSYSFFSDLLFLSFSFFLFLALPSSFLLFSDFHFLSFFLFLFFLLCLSLSCSFLLTFSFYLSFCFSFFLCLLISYSFFLTFSFLPVSLSYSTFLFFFFVFFFSIIPESTCERKETVDIDILVTSRNGDRKIMQSIRITSTPPTTYKNKEVEPFQLVQMNIYRSI